MNIPGGQVPVTMAILESLRKCCLDTTIICGKRLEKTAFEKRWGINISGNRELVLPLWPSKIQIYFPFLLPFIAKNFCNVLINPWTSDILPYVDITYIHGPKPLILQQKACENIFWRCYYKPYMIMERALGSSVVAQKKIVLANSFFTAGLLKEQLGVQSEVVYPPVDLPKFDISQSINKKQNVVLTIARFSPDKNLEMIPNIAKHVDALFVILGAIGDLRTFYRMSSLITKCGLRDKVVLLVNAPNNYVLKRELLYKAKVILSTSFFEPFGITLVEGMGAGCIPVSHDSGGPREFVPSMWLYKDQESAIQKVSEALTMWSPSIALDMCNIAYQFDKTKFIEIFSEKVNLLLREMHGA
ncbi:MAG: glycosyltransferase [Candidatus Bathyarchaeia archaeon]